MYKSNYFGFSKLIQYICPLQLYFMSYCQYTNLLYDDTIQNDDKKEFIIINLFVISQLLSRYRVRVAQKNQIIKSFLVSQFSCRTVKKINASIDTHIDIHTYGGMTEQHTCHRWHIWHIWHIWHTWHLAFDMHIYVNMGLKRKFRTSGVKPTILDIIDNCF